MKRRERSIILTKHDIHLLNSPSISSKKKYKLLVKLKRISKNLIPDLLVIMHSRHLERWNADNAFFWKRMNAQINRFITILPALNLEVVTVYRYKIKYKKIGNERYYWKERDNSPYSKKMGKSTYPIIGIKGGYIRRVLRAAVEHNIIPASESKAITLSEIRRRLRSEA